MTYTAQVKTNSDTDIHSILAASASPHVASVYWVDIDRVSITLIDGADIAAFEELMEADANVLAYTDRVSIAPEGWEEESGKNGEQTVSDARDAAHAAHAAIITRYQNCEGVSRLIAADIAESVLHLFEQQYPSDGRVRAAIDAAWAYAAGEITTEALTAAAGAASAAAHAAVAEARDEAVAAAPWGAAWAARAAAIAAAPWDAVAWAADADDVASAAAHAAIAAEWAAGWDETTWGAAWEAARATAIAAAEWDAAA